MKWYENHRHNWSYCHDLRFWISLYFLCGWEAIEYGEIPPFCVYAICHMLIYAAMRLCLTIDIDIFRCAIILLQR